MRIVLTRILPVTALCSTMALSALGQKAIQVAPNKLPNVILDLRGQKVDSNPKAPDQKAVSRATARATNSLSLTESICNLVTNGDFDGQLSAPAGQINNVSFPAPSGRPGELANWESTNYTSPDYFSTNAPPYSSSYPPYEGLGTNPSTATGGPFTPYNYDPSPNAHNGCLGLVTIADFPDGSGGTNPYAEYATQQLTSPLRSGHNYYASMQVYSGSYGKYATAVGLDITTDARDFRYNPFKLYTFTGHGIQSPGIVSAQQWTFISGTFPGVDGAQWINVGNFQQANRQLVRPSAKWNYAYTYVDAIKVYEIPEAGPSSSYPCGLPVTIGTGCDIPGATYAWTVAGSSTPFASTLQTTVTPTTTTTYTLVVTLPNNQTSTSSVTISAAPPSMGALYGEPQVCYDRTGDGRDRTTLVINSPVPTGYSYYSQLVENATGRVVDDNLDGLTKPDGTFSYTLIGGNYTVGNYTLRVRLQGPCPSAWQTKPIFIVSCTTQGGPCTGRGCDGARAYPNPVAGSLSLPEGTQEATLVNSQGSIIQTTGQVNALDVRKLPDGLYNLRMKKGGKIINQRIQITH